tara:strand:+ start:861 stop:962 length:102 start_codon:yes stop_codon:yes gene_type:complete
MNKRKQVKVRKALRATKQTLNNLSIGAAYALKN